MAEQAIQKALFVINPKAGRRMGQAFEAKLTGLFADSGMRVTAIITRGRGHATEIVEQMGGHYDLVVCAGGDGTLHEVANGLMRLPSPPKLGYIPAGTFNDVAHSLGLPTRLLDAGRVVTRGEARSLDIGSFQDTFFVYIACCGLFADVPYLTSQFKKSMMGGSAYFFDALKRLRRIPAYRMQIEHDGGVIEDEFIFCSISNTRRFAGGIVRFQPPDAQLDDGLFEMLLVKNPHGLPALARVYRQLLRQRYDMPCVRLLHTARARFRCDAPVPWTLDGENGGAHREVRIENRRRGIDILA